MEDNLVKVENLSQDNYETPDVFIPEDQSLYFGNNDFVDILGSAEQRQEMFAAWSEYIGEVSNPLKTAANYNKGNYAPLDEVLNETRPLLAKHGFGIMQVPVADGNKVSLTTMITFKNGACMTFPKLTMNAAKDDPQTVIATVTYARRAALNAILAIYGENDDDGNAASGSGKKKGSSSQPKKVSELDKARQNVVELCKKKIAEGFAANALYDTIKEYNGGNRQPNSIPDVETCDKVITAINSLVKE